MFIEIQRGKSFGGLTRYCLGPGEIGSENRVQFVETLNLATQNAEAAWRIMAARHYVQDELKAKHGIRVGDRGRPVGHMVISWSADEAAAQDLGKDAMMKAARGALAAIGAQDNQAIVIAHDDTEHPHCHVVINLIGNDGRLKDNDYENRKLSRFALDLETQIHGEPVVKKRFKNWQDRNAGETPYPVKKKARHLYEIEKAVETGDIRPEVANRLLAEQATIEKKRLAIAALQKQHIDKLRWCHEERKKRIHDSSKLAIRLANTNTRKRFAETWDKLYDQQLEERAKFNTKEESLKGSLENALQLVDWFAIGKRPSDTGTGGLRRFFNLLVSESSRREELSKRQEAERCELRNRQRRIERELHSDARKKRKEQLNSERKSFQLKLGRMVKRHELQTNQLNEQQKSLARERNHILERPRVLERNRKRLHSEERQYILELKESFNRATDVGDEAAQGEQEDSRSPQGRIRRVRDPKNSRRRRRQRGETAEQYQERINRLGLDPVREQPDIDRDH